MQEEMRIRFLEDVGALLAGRDLGMLVGGGVPEFPSVGDYEGRRELLERVIGWEIVGGFGVGRMFGGGFYLRGVCFRYRMIGMGGRVRI